MRHGSLFSGIGGFDLAAEWMGWENVFQVEKDPWCRQQLKKSFPRTKQYGAIEDFNGLEYEGTIDVLSGGDPCQPSSTAGKGLGKADDRFLWPQKYRVIKAIRPKVVVNENVSGSIANGILDHKIVDLVREGYTCWPPILMPSSAAGSLHRRDRVWLVAYSDVYGLSYEPEQLAEYLQAERNESESTSPIGSLSWPFIQSGQIEKLFTSEPPLVRTGDGIPKELDAIAAIGNSADPRIIHEIFKAIESLQPQPVS